MNSSMSLARTTSETTVAHAALEAQSSDGSETAGSADPSELTAYRSFFEELMAIKEVNRTDLMMEFLAIFLEIAKLMRETSTTLSTVGFQTQIAELKSVAEKIRSEGDKSYHAGMMRGGMSIASGVTVAGLGGGSGIQQMNGVRKSLAAERKSHEISDLNSRLARDQDELAALRRDQRDQKDPQDVARQITLGQSIQADGASLVGHRQQFLGLSQESKTLETTVNNWMTASRATDAIGGATGAMSGSAYEQQANREKTDQTLHQAASTAGEQNKALAEKSAEASQSTVAALLQAARDVGQAEGEALMAASRV